MHRQHAHLQENGSDQERIFQSGSNRGCTDNLVFGIEVTNTSSQREGKEPAKGKTLKMQESKGII